MALAPTGAARRLAVPATLAVAGIALVALLLSRGPLASAPTGAGLAVITPAPTLASPQSAPSQASPSVVSTTPTPAPSPTPTATAAVTPRPRTYTVRSGDTLYEIAVTHGTTVKVLARLNDITNTSLLRVGQVLQLP